MVPDDQPIPIKVRNGRLIAVPYSTEINDIRVMGVRGYPADKWAAMMKAFFDQLYREGAENGMVVCMPLHPFVVGQPHRIGALHDVLAARDVARSMSGSRPRAKSPTGTISITTTRRCATAPPMKAGARMTPRPSDLPASPRGLDHDWFDAPADASSAQADLWPDGKPIALWITVPVEFFPLDAPAQPFRPLGGLTAGLSRLLELQQPGLWPAHRHLPNHAGARIDLDLRATAAVNAAAADAYPRVVDEMRSRDTGRSWRTASTWATCTMAILRVEDERELIRTAHATS